MQITKSFATTLIKGIYNTKTTKAPFTKKAGKSPTEKVCVSYRDRTISHKLTELV